MWQNIEEHLNRMLATKQLNTAPGCILEVI
jgi:hypothetical protein